MEIGQCPHLDHHSGIIIIPRLVAHSSGELTFPLSTNISMMLLKTMHSILVIIPMAILIHGFLTLVEVFGKNISIFASTSSVGSQTRRQLASFGQELGIMI